MPIDPDHPVSITEESQGVFRAVRKDVREQPASDKEVLDVSRHLIAENRNAYEALARQSPSC